MMNVFDVCPRCKGLGIRVPIATVSYHSGSGIKKKSGDWYGCCCAACEVGYFSGDSLLLLSDLNTKIWFKDLRMDVPICYCSNITRSEIYKAVDAGCTDIKSVRAYLDKNITGECELKNPLGGCCHKAFLIEINNHMNKGSKSVSIREI